MKFATKPLRHYPHHLRYVATLPWKIKIQIFCRYSADMEENANKLHFECTDEYQSPMISHGQSCGSAVCPIDSKLNQNVGQCPSWWSPSRTQVAPSVQRRNVWLTPTTRCRAVTLPRRETRGNLQGCLRLPDRSQPLVGRSSPYCGDMWRTYCCWTSFFRLLIRALVAKI